MVHSIENKTHAAKCWVQVHERSLIEPWGLVSGIVQLMTKIATEIKQLWEYNRDNRMRGAALNEAGMDSPCSTCHIPDGWTWGYITKC